MAFEVYRPRGDKRQGKQPIVSLSRSSIVLNNPARALLNSSRIELAFDKDSGKIRIKGLNEGGIELKKTKVFGKGFFNQFGISKKGKFQAMYEPAENALYIQI